MCAFKHESNELLRSFHEQCVHLTLLFLGLSDAHNLYAKNCHEEKMRVLMNSHIRVILMCLHVEKNKLCDNVTCMNA